MYYYPFLHLESHLLLFFLHHSPSPVTPWCYQVMFKLGEKGLNIHKEVEEVH